MMKLPIRYHKFPQNSAPILPDDQINYFGWQPIVLVPQFQQTNKIALHWAYPSHASHNSLLMQTY